MMNSRSFRLTQSLSFFQPLMLSHSNSHSHLLSQSVSGVGINFLGNTSTNRAQRLLSFVHAHKAVLNLIVRSRPAVLEGSLAALVRVTQLRSYLGFDAKRKYFFTQLHKMRPDRGRRNVHLQLRRGVCLIGYKRFINKSIIILMTIIFIDSVTIIHRTCPFHYCSLSLIRMTMINFTRHRHSQHYHHHHHYHYYHHHRYHYYHHHRYYYYYYYYYHDVCLLTLFIRSSVRRFVPPAQNENSRRNGRQTSSQFPWRGR